MVKKKTIKIKTVTADVPEGDVNISYKNTRIAGLSESVTAVLETKDTICEDDIEVAYTKSGKETVSWHQCPEAVRNFITAAQAAYPSNDNTTVIDDYAPAKGSELDSNTKPVGKVIDGTTFYNNVPNIAEPFATANKAGTLTALDGLRWMNTTSSAVVSGETYPRGKNCRDLGGWTCDGGTVKYGLIYRGGEPNPVDADLMVGKNHIVTEVQLLPVSEQPTNYKMESVWGIDWAGNDTQSDSVYTINDSKTLWRKLIEPIMDSVIHHKPVLFHCGVGADRTGIIAIALESILGMSKSDIDIEYELTNFSTGWQTLPGGIYRARTYNAYQAMNTAVNNVALATGLTDSWRNRWVSFLLTCGITIDKINAFRSAMIDGTPDTISVTVPSYTISNTLIHVSNSNAATSIDQYQSYVATLTADTGYAITSVTITMGGADASQYYSNGTLNIPSVTGNINITVTATEVIRENLLTMNDGLINKRFNATNTESSANGYFISDYFAYSSGGLRIVKGYSNANSLAGSNHYGNIRIGFYGDNKSFISAAYISDTDETGSTLYFAFNKDGDDWVRTNMATYTGVSDWSAVKYIRVTLALNGAVSTISAVSDVTNSGMKIYAE